MKRLFLLVLAMVLVVGASAQGISYKHNGRKNGEKCVVTFDAYCYNNQSYVVVKVRSSETILPADPTLMLRLNDDSLMVLGGASSTTSKAQSNSGVRCTTLTGDVVTTVAMFPIKNKDIKRLLIGIEKVRIDLVPSVHEIKFRHDKIGRKLYKLFKNAKERDLEYMN